MWVLIIIAIVIFIAFKFHDNRLTKIKEYIASIDGTYHSYDPLSLTSYGYDLIEKLKSNSFNREKFYTVIYTDKNKKQRRLIVSFDFFNEKMKIYENKPNE